MPTVSSITNHFPSAVEGFTTTLASTISSGATTVPLNSVSGYTNGAIAVFVVEPTSTTAKQAFTGVIDTAGVQVTGVVWTEGTNQSHASGSTVVDYATATHMSMTTKGILVHSDQDGTLKAGAVDVAGVLASDVVTTAKILASNVTTAKIANANVTTAKIANANVTAAKLEFGMVRNRQGGTSGDGAWNTTGTTNTDTSAKSAFIQAGTNTTSGGTRVVTFPSAFTQAPIVFANVIAGSNGFWMQMDSAASTTQVTFTCWSATGTTADKLFSWVAIGQ